MDPLQSVHGTAAGQGCTGVCDRPHGSRECLLKGCGKWFQPACSRARYCSPECQEAAYHWRRWRAARQYRTTPGGQARRRAQCCRYRVRKRECQHSENSTPVDADQPVDAERPVDSEPPREGQRAAEIPQNPGTCACDRPGCYDLFVRQPRSPDQHFCSSACRQALRRVLDRERRLRARRRRGTPARRHYPHGPP